MKITVELPEQDVKDIMRFSGEKRGAPAVRKFIATGLMLRRRRSISQKILSGEWSADLPPIKALRKERKVWER